jgi:hypothetical protein
MKSGPAVLYQLPVTYNCIGVVSPTHSKSRADKDTTSYDWTQVRFSEKRMLVQVLMIEPKRHMRLYLRADTGQAKPAVLSGKGRNTNGVKKSSRFKRTAVLQLPNGKPVFHAYVQTLYGALTIFTTFDNINAQIIG